MKERPILFSGAMVRAILEGRKTQTRRRVHPDWLESLGDPDTWTARGTAGWDAFDHHANEMRSFQSPYGKPGDRLWVRETWRAETTGETRNVYYRADEEWHEGAGWKPSIHMHRWASRLTLEVTEVRVQRLQEISEDDARAEGVRDHIYPASGDHPALAGYVTDADGEFGAAHVTRREAFQSLWDSINGERPGCSWQATPWVWCVSFRRLP